LDLPPQAPVVALVVTEMAFKPEIESFTVVLRSHNVPGSPTFRQVIERGKLARRL